LYAAMNISHPHQRSQGALAVGHADGLGYADLCSGPVLVIDPGKSPRHSSFV